MQVRLDHAGIAAAKQNHWRLHGRALEDARRYLTHIHRMLEVGDVRREFLVTWISKFQKLFRNATIEVEHVRTGLGAQHCSAVANELEPSISVDPARLVHCDVVLNDA